MRYFLAKTEPSTYSIGDLERERETTWDGVRNPQALKVVRSMKPGDRVLIYHSGGESQIVGVAEVSSEPEPDPKNPKLSVVSLRYVCTLTLPVTLRAIKETGQFEDFALVRQSRLSTMEVPDAFLRWMRDLTRTTF